MKTFVQNLDEVKKNYIRRAIESKQYRGSIPKKKRIRNKIKKQRETKVYMLDEYHIIGVNNNNQSIFMPKEIDHKDMQIIGTSGKGQVHHYDGKGNRI
ncbi:TPA: hypothetical protein PRL28_002282 [Staphylococcus aureus]|nr:hypothetical protein [Staphylococcus aureus]